MLRIWGRTNSVNVQTVLWCCAELGLAAQRDTQRVLTALEAQLGTTRFVAGETLTMGDIPVAAMTNRCFALGAERGKLPNVTRWYDELATRAAYRATIMLPLS